MSIQQDTREIEQITFGILSAEEIIKLAVCEINSPKLCNTDKTAYNTVYDPRLGTIDNSVNCQTCDQDLWACPGHFGYIKLNEPVIHPLYYKQVGSIHQMLLYHSPNHESEICNCCW